MVDMYQFTVVLPHSQHLGVELQASLGVFNSHHGLLHDEVLAAGIRLSHVRLIVGTWNITFSHLLMDSCNYSPTCSYVTHKVESLEFMHGYNYTDNYKVNSQIRAAHLHFANKNTHSACVNLE